MKTWDFNLITGAVISIIYLLLSIWTAIFDSGDLMKSVYIAISLIVIAWLVWNLIKNVFLPSVD